MARRFRIGVVLAALAALPCAAQQASHAIADGARDKVDAIIAHGETPRGRQAATIRTALTEVEINAYLQVHGPEVLPSGIAEPEIRIGDEGRVRARATVDLDAVRRSRPRAWRDPLAYITGSVQVIASGRVTADQGIGRADIESATVAGISVPKSVVQELIRFYTASEERPDGIDLERGFELPAGIRRVIVERGRVTVVQ